MRWLRALTRTRRRMVAMGAAVAVLVVGVGGTMYVRGSSAPVTYRTTTAVLGTVRQTLSLTGNLTPVAQSNVSFQVAGTVTAVDVSVGEQVTAGQVLATVDPTALQEALTQAQANLTAAQAKLSADQGATSAAGTSTAQQVATAQTNLTNDERAYTDTVAVNAQTISTDQQESLVMTPRTPLVLCGAALLLAACGSATNAAGGTAPSAGAQAGGGRGGTFGQIVQVNGNALTVSTASGDVNVDYTRATTITSTSTGSPGDIVTGTCVAIAALKDTSGGVTATTVRLSRPTNGSCSSTAFPGGPRPGGRFSPPAVSPGATPRPTPNANAVLVTGMVTAVSGTTVTVTPATGSATAVTVPTTLSITESSAGTASDLTVDPCVRAVGQKNSQGVVQATALTLQPASSTGTCTAPGGGGFGGRFPGGGGGGFPGAATPAAG